MAITDKDKGVWGIDQVFAKQNQGSIWEYTPLRKLFLAGRNGYGGIGQNSTNNGYSSPVQVPGTTWYAGTTIGTYSAAGIKSDGTLWAWGYNGYGQLGHGNTTDYSSPRQIPGTNWSRVSSYIGHDSVLATRTDGTLWAWGQNEYGQLGQNNKTNQSSPIQIPGTTWSSASYSIHQSGYYGMAIKTDGTLWMWGSNSGGMLGQSNQTQYSSPRQIPGTTWAKCGKGYNTTLALKTDNTGWSWGQNGYGDLGLGDKSQYSSPKQISGSWKMLSGADNSGMGIKTDGTLWGWGRNSQGQLGLNQAYAPSGSSSGTPQEVTGAGTTWDSIASGWGNFMFGKSDGTLWGVGNNDEGQFGKNNRTKYSSPVQIPGTVWAGFERVGGIGDIGFMLQEE